MTRTLRPRLHHTLLALLITVSALVAACGSSAPTNPSTGSPTATTPMPSQPASPAGAYNFAAVNGTPVPGVFDSYEPGLGIKMAMEAVRGRLMLNQDGTYLQEMEMRLRSNVGGDRVLIRAAAGAYTMTGGTLTMTPFEGVPFQPYYTPGLIEIQTEAPGLDGTPEVFIFTFRQ